MIANLGFCSSTVEVWDFIGTFITVLKIVIPIIIIIMGAIDLGKAVIATKEDEIKKASTSLFKRLIAGLIIFFIPTIVNAVFGLVSSFSEVESDYQVCFDCIAGNSDGCVATDDESDDEE